MSENVDPRARSNELLSRSDSRLLVVDVQDKLLAHIPVADKLIDNCHRMIDGAQILGIPVSASEQYPKGLGATAASLAQKLDKIPEKLRFSCTEALGWGFASEITDDRDKIVLVGIEAHVCILQTALDLLAHGFQVYVPADAVASRSKFD